LLQVVDEAYVKIRSLGELQERRRVPIGDLDEYCGKLNTALIEVVYEWASRTPFGEICQLTDVRCAHVCARV
jgi:hypothetical protein